MDTIKFTQAEKAKQLYQLHHAGEILILPNIWDVLGARLLNDLGYKAVATASASIAFTNGYNDGEHIPFNCLLQVLKRIAGSVPVPVTADIESGYAAAETVFAENIRQLITTGIAGINIEDTDMQTQTLLPVTVQCERIKLIKKIAFECEVPLFINARTDTFIHDRLFTSAEQQLHETIERGMAYKAAGAHCFYPVLMHKQAQIATLVKAIEMPVNILLTGAAPSINALQGMGVARVSLGPGFLKHAIQAMQQLAFTLQQHEGLADIAANTVTSVYLKKLVTG